MATVTTHEPRTETLDPRLSHPLDRLRGIIRRYVVIEGVLSAALFLAVWFTLALVFDFALFKTTIWDWVLDAPWALRLIVLLIVLGLFIALITRRIVNRLNKELSYPALALVLERRFPKLLGDRLITAVELADVARAEREGYSAAMVRQTIAEARSRVGDVPVHEVFNWRRLWRLGFVTAGLLVFLLVAGFVSYAIATGSLNVSRFSWRAVHVSGILLERNALLQNTPWPRRAHLELVGFPEGEPLRVGKDAAAPTVRVRAYRYLIADRSARLGWRPMTWADLTADLIGTEAPSAPFAQFDSVEGTSATGSGSWFVDDVVGRDETLRAKVVEARTQMKALQDKAAELEAQGRLRRQTDGPLADRWQIVGESPGSWRPMKWADVKAVLNLQSVPDVASSRLKPVADRPETHSIDAPALEWPVGLIEARLPLLEAELAPIRDALDRLAEVVDRPSMGRTVRRLDTPGRVVLEYTGKTKSSDATLEAEQNNAFAGQVSDLKEDVWFVVKAEDFRTEPREIRLINPPMFEHLYRTDYQPAYLYHAPPAPGGYEAFRTLPLQRMRDLPLSLTGERSIFTVPSGTEVVLTGVADTELRAAYLEPRVGYLPGATPGSRELIPLPIGEDGRTITIELRGDYRLGANREFTHIFLDEEGWVTGETVTSTPAVEFDIILEEKYGVQARRQVLIQTADDIAPSVEVQLDGLRKVNTLRVLVEQKDASVQLAVPCFLITPLARLEFNTDSVIRDDHGLSQVSYEVDRWVQTYQDLGGGARPSETRLNRLAGSYPVGRFIEQRKDIVSRPHNDLVAMLTRPLREEEQSPQVTELKLKNPDVDFFDVEALKLSPTSATEGQLHYRIDLAIEATDTNYLSGPKKSRSKEPMNLLVVSEPELLAVMNEDEDKLAKRMTDTVKLITETREKFQFVKNQNGLAPLAEVPSTRLKAIDVSQDVVRAREAVQGVLLDCRRLYRECRINRISEKTTVRYGRLANRVDRVLGGDPLTINSEEEEELRNGRITPKGTFKVTDAALNTVVGQLVSPLTAEPPEGRWADREAVLTAEKELANLEMELSVIRDELGNAVGYAETVGKLKVLLANRRRQTEELVALHKKLVEEQLVDVPLIKPVGQVLLTKGETKKIKQGIDWRQYKEDQLSVTLESSDPNAVGVTKQLKLTFEEHQNEFEYELKAGQQVGDYTITVKPAAGKPVMVMVKVQ